VVADARGSLEDGRCSGSASEPGWQAGARGRRWNDASGRQGLTPQAGSAPHILAAGQTPVRQAALARGFRRALCGEAACRAARPRPVGALCMLALAICAQAGRRLQHTSKMPPPPGAFFLPLAGFLPLEGAAACS